MDKKRKKASGTVRDMQQDEAVVPVMLVSGEPTGARDETLTLWDIAQAIRHRRWPLLIITSVFALSALTYALTSPQWYRAEVLLSPTQEGATPQLGAQLGGLAALAGVRLNGDSSADSIAILRSRDFAREFIADFSLVAVFFPETPKNRIGRWWASLSEEDRDVNDSVDYFHREILTVTEESSTGHIRVAVEWKDPVEAQLWARSLVRRLNEVIQGRTLSEAKQNIEYLREELARTTVVPLQQSIGNLLETDKIRPLQFRTSK